MRVPVFAPQPWVMGVVNVTPDSFSDGGRWLDTDAAVAHGLELVEQGAAMIDVGGESTRPGAHRVDAATERDRVVPVISALADAGVCCSVDTTRAEVAAAAIEAGAAIINDVSGGLADPAMAGTVAAAQLPWILMHWRGPSDTMDSLARYDDVVLEVTEELLARVEAAVAAGVDERNIIIDPGLGFAKTAEHNWAIVRHLEQLADHGLPVLIGASRKRFLGSLLAAPDGTPRPAHERENATAAVSLLAAQRGVWGVRVHDVRPTLDALAVLRCGGAGQAGESAQVGQSAQAGQGAPAGESPPAPLLSVPFSADVPGYRTGVLRRPGTAAAAAHASEGRIRLVGLTARGHHGVHDHERRDGQDFVIDIDLRRDVSRAADSDDLLETVDYAALAELAAAVVSGPPRNLIETVASEIADRIMTRFAPAAVDVTVHKPHAPIPRQFGDVAVTVRRTAASARARR